MIINTKSLKSRLIKIAFLVIVLFVIGFTVYNDNTKLSATDLLENANFDAESQTVNVHKINVDNSPDIFEEIMIPEETQQELIRTFENAQFESVGDRGRMDFNYRINMVLNTGYVMFLDSTTKSIRVVDNNQTYVTVIDNDFFDILENATK